MRVLCGTVVWSGTLVRAQSGFTHGIVVEHELGGLVNTARQLAHRGKRLWKLAGDIDFAFGAYPSFFSAVQEGLPLVVAGWRRRQTAAVRFSSLSTLRRMRPSKTLWMRSISVLKH